MNLRIKSDYFFKQLRSSRLLWRSVVFSLHLVLYETPIPPLPALVQSNTAYNNPWLQDNLK
jgi:hypothetical protein